MRFSQPFSSRSSLSRPSLKECSRIVWTTLTHIWNQAGTRSTALLCLFQLPTYSWSTFWEKQVLSFQHLRPWELWEHFDHWEWLGLSQTWRRWWTPFSLRFLPSATSLWLDYSSFWSLQWLALVSSKESSTHAQRMDQGLLPSKIALMEDLTGLMVTVTLTISFRQWEPSSSLQQLRVGPESCTQVSMLLELTWSRNRIDILAWSSTSSVLWFAEHFSSWICLLVSSSTTLTRRRTGKKHLKKKMVVEISRLSLFAKLSQKGGRSSKRNVLNLMAGEDKSTPWCIARFLTSSLFWSLCWTR